MDISVLGSEFRVKVGLAIWSPTVQSLGFTASRPFQGGKTIVELQRHGL